MEFVITLKYVAILVRMNILGHQYSIRTSTVATILLLRTVQYHYFEGPYEYEYVRCLIVGTYLLLFLHADLYLFSELRTQNLSSSSYLLIINGVHFQYKSEKLPQSTPSVPHRKVLPPFSISSPLSQTTSLTVQRFTFYSECLICLR